MELMPIGYVAGVFGLAGDVRVRPLVDDSDIFQRLKEVTLKSKAGASELYKVTRTRAHKDLWLVKLQGVNTPEDGMLLKGQTLLISSNALPALDDDTVYWVHIKGFDVYDTDGVFVGVLEDYTETGSYDSFSIRGADNKEYMISNNPHHVLKIDVEGRKVIIDRIGLVD